MKTAFVFSGQGAQYINMGKELYDSFDICRETFEEANSALDFKVEDICFNEDSRINITEFTQPLILTVSIAFFRLLEQNNIKADYYAGLSLGEYSALVASGALDFKETVALVKKRGKVMQEAVPEEFGGMTAVMNCSREVVLDVCNKASEKGVVSIANYNMPGQIVISGEIKALEEAERIFKESGVKKFIRLKVSGPFHTALLKSASEKLNVELNKITIKELQKPVITNLTAKEIQSPNEIVDILTKQVMSSVYWEDTIVNLIEKGVTRFIEVGPAKTLSAFIKKINAQVEILNVEDLQSFQNILNLYN